MSPPKQSATSTTPDPQQQQPYSRASLEQERYGYREVCSPSSQIPITEQSPTSEQPHHGVSHREPQAEGPSPGQEEAHQQTTSQSSFRPFFTLIKDTNTSQYSHPNVRYIFSDDDSDQITDAALQSLQVAHHDDPAEPNQPSRRKQQSTLANEGIDSSAPEHYIVLDMEPVTEPEQDTSSSATAEKNPSAERNQTYKITSANSLTPSWAVLNAKISPAPAFDSSSNSPPSTQDEPSPVGGLMLKIEGTSGFDGMATTSGGGTAGGSPRPQPSRRKTTEDMLDQFHKRMDELRLVVEAGGQHKDGEEPKDEQQKDEGEKGEQQEGQKNE